MNIKRCGTCGMTTNEACGNPKCDIEIDALAVPVFAQLERRQVVMEAAEKVMREQAPILKKLAEYEKSEYMTMADKITQHSGDGILERRKEALSAPTAAKFDSGKAPVSLIPKSALIGAAEVLEMGKKKYSAHNWKKGMEWSRLVDATMRHLLSWNEGVSIDEESGKSHLHHCLVNLMFLCEYEEKGLGTDDRYKGKEKE